MTKLIKKKKIEKRKKKYYQSNEERKMKDRKPILNKSYFEGKTDPGENRSRKRNRINNINTIISLMKKL